MPRPPCVVARLSQMWLRIFGAVNWLAIRGPRRVTHLDDGALLLDDIGTTLKTFR